MIGSIVKVNCGRPILPRPPAIESSEARADRLAADRAWLERMRALTVKALDGLTVADLVAKEDP